MVAERGGVFGLTRLVEDPALQEMLLLLLTHRAAFAAFGTVHVILLQPLKTDSLTEIKLVPVHCRHGA